MDCGYDIHLQRWNGVTSIYLVFLGGWLLAEDLDND